MRAHLLNTLKINSFFATVCLFFSKQLFIPQRDAGSENETSEEPTSSKSSSSSRECRAGCSWGAAPPPDERTSRSRLLPSHRRLLRYSLHEHHYLIDSAMAVTVCQPSGLVDRAEQELTLTQLQTTIGNLAPSLLPLAAAGDDL